MRARITAAVGLVLLLGVGGCTQPTQTCVIADYDPGTSGYGTPQQALQSVLAKHQPGLSETGWKLTERGARAASFVSGNDRVDVVKNQAGQWTIGGVTVCR